MKFEECLNEKNQDADLVIDKFTKEKKIEDKFYVLSNFLSTIEKKYGKQKDVRDWLKHYEGDVGSNVGKILFDKISKKLLSLGK